ncbi:hypothetical protein COU54_04505 [Candidatus Pacearchaeota archaeon CG10_big_fil_rev_8_21_14_0_10_31_24]|nr:MAG: hypothetical protein COU54_04505 [Candidatus Pacearchaeota archaeon CG10_big_fil_rev_8_21_14_0_10_31_24]
MLKQAKKIAIITEFLYFFGGIEKSILLLVQELKKRGVQVDIYAGIYNPKKTFEEFKSLKVKSFKNERLPPIINTLYLRRKFKNFKLKGYDGYIFYGSHSLSAGKNHHPNVWWSTRPLAYLYGSEGKGADKNTDYLHQGKFIKRILMHIYLRILKIIDKRDIKGIDQIRIVGELVKPAIERAYPGRKIPLLYQPVDIHQYKYISNGKYYLNAARHSDDKNVDRVIKAFQKMPDKRLYQSGAGPNSEKIKELAKGHKNIKLFGFTDEKVLRELNGKCIATISAAEGEDFSMNLIEGIASGKPTISVNLDNKKSQMEVTKTGVLIPNSSPEEIIKAVKYLDSKKALKMRKNCEEKSKIFSTENHVNGLLKAMGLR